MQKSVSCFVHLMKEIHVFVLNWTDRPNPPLSGQVLNIFPNNQDPQGATGYMLTTMSPTVKLLRGLIHFCLSSSYGKYSLTHHFQKRSDRYCTFSDILISFIKQSKRHGFRLEEDNMICRECLKIIYIVRGFCHGTAVKNGFYLTQKSLKAFIIHRLLSDA